MREKKVGAAPGAVKRKRGAVEVEEGPAARREALLVPYALWQALREHHGRLFEGVGAAWRHTDPRARRRLRFLADYLHARHEDGRDGRHVAWCWYLAGLFHRSDPTVAKAKCDRWLAAGGVRASWTDWSFAEHRARRVELAFHPEVARAAEHLRAGGYRQPGELWIRLDDPYGKPAPLGARRRPPSRGEALRAARAAAAACENPVLRERVELYLEKPCDLSGDLARRGLEAAAAARALGGEAAKANLALLDRLRRAPRFLPGVDPLKDKQSARIGSSANPGSLSKSVRRALFPKDVEADLCASWLCIAACLGKAERAREALRACVEGGGDPWGEAALRALERCGVSAEEAARAPGLLARARAELKLRVQMRLCGAGPGALGGGEPLRCRELPKEHPLREVPGFYAAAAEDPVCGPVIEAAWGPGGLGPELVRRGAVRCENGDVVRIEDRPGEGFPERLARARSALAAAYDRIEAAGICAALRHLRDRGASALRVRCDLHDGFTVRRRRPGAGKRALAGCAEAAAQALRARGCFGRLRVQEQGL